MKEAFQADDILAGLKPFQRKTVDYVFRRMYIDAKPTSRMLVADEVGLGKTMIARGLIARAIEHLRDRVGTRRIDIVYVCSNAAIARQNVNRLNVFREAEFEVATRLTLLPIELQELKKREINFVSFTPSTTFDLKSRSGTARERLVLYHMLRGELGLREAGLRRVLRGPVQPEGWRRRLDAWDETIEPTLKRLFLETVRADADLVRELHALCAELDERTAKIPVSTRNRIYQAIGSLRSLLATVCVRALEPDLIILDEFQRFRHLLEMKEPNEAAMLAQTLMGFRDRDTGLDARVLMLSATPYAMYTTAQDDEDDHHRDFLATMRFLLENDEEKIAELDRDLARYRRALYATAGQSAGEGGSDRGQGVLETSKSAAAEPSGDAGPTAVAALEDPAAAMNAIRGRIEGALRSVMVRTERVGATRGRDSMLVETAESIRPEARDLLAAVAWSDIAKAVHARDVVEYWKAAPYLLNFMRSDGYQLKSRLADQEGKASLELTRALDRASTTLLGSQSLSDYDELDPGNARMRGLVEQTVGAGQWQWLWMPPALPYTRPEGAFANGAQPTKSLVFSAWQVVPDAIAGICSYEAERRMLAEDSDRPDYQDLHEKRSGLLQYRVERSDAEGRLGGMMALALAYPCRALVRAVDPLALAVALGGNGDSEPPDRARLVAAAQEQVRQALAATDSWGEPQAAGRADQRWYWAALAMLDAADPSSRNWLRGPHGWRSLAQNEGNQLGAGFEVHLEELDRAFDARDLDLGPPPDDLVDVLTTIALAAPGVCALRALSRLGFDEAFASDESLTAAAKIGEGLRSLFNQPTAMAMLRGRGLDVPYWRHVLDYALAGNLQAVLDEYVHILREANGHAGRGDAAVLQEVAEAAAEALGMRTSRVGIDELRIDSGASRFALQRFNLRTRFALRFGELKDDSGEVLARAGSVRQAFNSPFPPFILASTSIGQEGLDFHCYCHALYHWNLPANPVDLEQREGRIQRFKGHAVRRNVAMDVGLTGLRGRWDRRGDPWEVLFAIAAERVEDSVGGLIPYWIYEGEGEGAARIERRVPMLLMSREVGRLQKLKRGLAWPALRK